MKRRRNFKKIMTMAKLAAELKLNYEILPVLLLLRRCLPRRKKRRKMLPLSPPQKTKPLSSKNHESDQDFNENKKKMKTMKRNKNKTDSTP